MKKHAILSASASERWINCPPSARLEEQFPETTSEYAEEGSLAHEIAELKLRKQFTEPMGPQKFNRRMNKLKAHALYKEEMQSYTDVYYDYINQAAMSYEHTPMVAIETKLDLTDWVPEGFGTADCIVIGGDTLHVIDFKYGKGVPVSAENNSQMTLYALGAYQSYAAFCNIKKVKMVIVQPRLDSISEWEVSLQELLYLGAQIKASAEIAFRGEGEYNGGDWCRFCRAKAQCRANADRHTALEDFGYKKPPLLSDEEIGQILVTAKNLVTWAEDLKEYALTATLEGKTIPGWKAVEGKSNRKITDIEAAFAELKAAGYDEALLYERKPITLTATETLLGGKAKLTELIGQYVEKPRGKPTLAPETDKREPYSTAKDDFNTPLPDMNTPIDLGIPGVTAAYDQQVSTI